MSRSPTAEPASLVAPIARWIATAGGVGYLPVAPGTAASLPVALLAGWLGLPPRWLLALAILVTAVGIWAADREEARLGTPDPSSIVVDEVAGMLVAMVAGPPGLGWAAVLFFLFRLFDVWKPYPIDRLQALPGGWGIVVDDLVAGVYASVVARLAFAVWPRA